MSLPRLKIIPAGAGSGKTYTIQKELFRWIDDGLIRPEKIVAVTFGEAAAAELRDRIRARRFNGSPPVAANVRGFFRHLQSS